MPECLNLAFGPFNMSAGGQFMPKRVLTLTPIILFALIMVTSCSSTRDRVSPEWTKSMFFKNAQNAMDENRYDTALYYYEVFLVRYPEDHQKVIAAEYERAFIQYKKGDYKNATAGYEEIIRKYDESPYAMLYHPRFRYLCDIGLTNIEKQKSVKGRLFWRVREKDWAEEHGEDLVDEAGTEV